MKLELFISLGAAVVGLFAFVHSRYKSRELADLASDVAVLKKQMDLWWAFAEKQMIQNLHSPTHQERDALLDKMREEDLTKEEALKLAKMIAHEMEQRTDDRGELIMYLGAIVAKYELDSLVK